MSGKVSEKSGKRSPLYDKPRLVNRGPAGLLRSNKEPNVDTAEPEDGNGVSDNGDSVHILPRKGNKKPERPINNISEGLLPLVVDIEGILLDPQNARVHPERNMESIKESLATYGQLKPIVVRKENNTVVAGNGTLEAAKALGWTKIAVNYVEMTAAETAGYGLADNRTAELARWDFSVIAALDKLITESGELAEAGMTGWTSNELKALRTLDWTPPSALPEDKTAKNKPALVLKFSNAQYEYIRTAINALIIREGKVISNEEAVTAILRDWMGESEEEFEIDGVSEEKG